MVEVIRRRVDLGKAPVRVTCARTEVLELLWVLDELNLPIRSVAHRWPHRTPVGLAALPVGVTFRRVPPWRRVGSGGEVAIELAGPPGQEQAVAEAARQAVAEYVEANPTSHAAVHAMAGA